MAPIGSRGHFNEVDQAVEQGARQLHRFAVASSDLGHAVDLAAIVLDDCRMRDHLVGDGQISLVSHQAFALCGQFIGAYLKAGRRDACDDRVGDAFFGLVDVGQLPIDVSAACDQAPPFFCPSQAEFIEIGGDDIGMQKVALDRCPDAPLQDRVGYGRPVAAGSGLAVGAAAPAIGRNDDDRPAASGAAQLARKQTGLALALGMRAPVFIHALLDFCPGRGVDDLQFGNRLADLVASGIDPRNPLPGVGVFPEGLPIIDDFAQIKPVVQDAVAALAAADNGVRAPLPAARRCDAFDVQSLRDRGRALAGGIVGEDTANGRCLVFVDFAQPAFGLAIGAKGKDFAIAVG